MKIVHETCGCAARSKAGKLLTRQPVDRFGGPAGLAALCPSCAGRIRGVGQEQSWYGRRQAWEKYRRACGPALDSIRALIAARREVL